MIFIGHPGHPEVEGTMGQYSNINSGIYLIKFVEDVFKISVKDPDNLCFMTQTTLSVEDVKKIEIALRQCFPVITALKRKDVCYATINRQEAVFNLTKLLDIILIIGSQYSSNSKKKREKK